MGNFMKIIFIAMLFSAFALNAQTNESFKLIVRTNIVTAPIFIREVDGKFYDTRHSQLWRNISGMIVEKNAEGATIQTYTTTKQPERYYVPSTLNENQENGAYAGPGSSGGHWSERVTSETTLPDKKIQVKNYRIGIVGEKVNVLAMMVSGSESMEVWDCGQPHHVSVISTNKIFIAGQ
jgi:hypothetical protein